MAKFSIDGTKFLLTWPRSSYATVTMILRLLQEVGRVLCAVVCKEQHMDGEEHHHALVVYEKRIKKKKNVFDEWGHGCNVKYLKTIKDVKRARNYVMKEGIFQEVGELDHKYDKLDKREKAYFALQHSNVECIDSGHFSFAELARLQTIRNLFIMDWPQFKRREVHWYYGSTGTGKTRTAWEHLAFEKGYKMQEVWMSSGRIDPFFNGYVGQKAVILDDFRPGFCKFEMLLRLLDGYPVTINVKGGYIQWMAEIIIITAPIAPNEMFVNHQTGEEWDNLDQLIRRIDLQMNFDLKPTQ